MNSPPPSPAAPPAFDALAPSSAAPALPAAALHQGAQRSAHGAAHDPDGQRALAHKQFRQQRSIVLGSIGTYAANIFMVSVLHLLGFIEWQHLIAFAGLALLSWLMVYAVVLARMDWMQSPSRFTGFQMALTVLPVAYAMYQLNGGARPLFAMIGTVVMIYGTLGLNRRGLLGVVAYYCGLYVLCLALMWRFQPERVDWRMDLAGLLVFTVSMLQIALLGGYIHNLRKNLRHRSDDLKAALEQISGLVNTDALTGLFNRRYMMEAMESQLTRSLRTAEPFSVCMIDIDLFKYINDTWGHEAGDEALKRVGSAMRHAVRASDSLGRWGGEEFILLMPDTDLEGALINAERMRVGMEEIACYDIAVGMAITVSIGVAQWRAGETTHSLISRADKALYRAKDAGRNRIEFSHA